jgi:hypothetical protein
MKEPNDFPPIVYSNKLRIRINIKSNKKEESKHFMDEIVLKPFLKNYFSLTPATK